MSVYPTRNVDKEIRDFLRDHADVGLPSPQIIAREEEIPRNTPFVAVQLTDWDEQDLNISEVRVNYEFTIAIVDRLSRNARQSYERASDTVDSVKEALRSDLSVENSFQDTQVLGGTVSPVTLQNESDTIPYMRHFLNITTWRNEQRTS